MKLFTVYQDKAISVYSPEYREVSSVKNWELNCQGEKKNIIGWAKKNCNMPEYLWLSWDSFIDCMRDYSQTNNERLHVVIEISEKGMSEDILIFAECMMTVMMSGEPLRITFKTRDAEDVEAVQKCILRAVSS